MTNSDKRLGEKIHELRTRLGITQKELAGDHITRNMLSLIESGNASPSVSTLRYLAERLGTSVGYLFASGPHDEGMYYKLAVIDELKSLMRNKQYDECARLCESLPDEAIDDELSHIAAVAFINLSNISADNLELPQAIAQLSRGKHYSSKTIYSTKSLSDAVQYYLTMYRSVCSDTIPAILQDPKFGSEYVPFNLTAYFSLLTASAAKNTENVSYSAAALTPFQAKHFRAIQLISEERFNDAIKILREMSLNATLPYYMKYRVLDSLEAAANETGDFRMAYSATRRKLELIEKCSGVEQAYANSNLSSIK